MATALLAVGCSLQFHDPAPKLAAPDPSNPWLVHCETALSHLPDEEVSPGARKARWLWARNPDGSSIALDGKLEDGFLVVNGIHQAGHAPLATSLAALRQQCLATLSRLNPGKPLELGKVRAARHNEEINAPMVFPSTTAPRFPVQRVVVFGDSLSDTGRLKKRLHVFPGEPYWLGRFSNGPNWVDYLGASTGLSMQSHAYGGASVTMHEKMPGDELFARIKQSGQMLVTGSLQQQVGDYINQNSTSRRVQRPDLTVFVIWAGANDYIWKEPFTGAITTFLNSPRGAAGYEAVVDEVIDTKRQQIEKLYAAGARRFLVINLPDLGNSPVILQNKTYFPPRPPESDAARKLELSRRFSKLTDYHNHKLKKMLDEVSIQLPDEVILQENAAEMVENMLNENSMRDYGFNFSQNSISLQQGTLEKRFQQRCYTGGYLGSNNSGDICLNSQQAFFWDAIHPTTLTHCWEAWFIGNKMAEANWIAPMPAHHTYRAWCELVADRQNGHRETAWRLSGL